MATSMFQSIVSGIKKVSGNIWEENFEHSAPEHSEVYSYQKLAFWDEKEQKFAQLGMYVPNLYERARSKNGSLSHQIQYKQWLRHQEDGLSPEELQDKLYQDNLTLFHALYIKTLGVNSWRLKTPLELAIIEKADPSLHFIKGEHARATVRQRMEQEIYFHLNNTDPELRAPLYAPNNSKFVVRENYFNGFLSKEEFEHRRKNGTLTDDTPRVVFWGEAMQVTVDLKKPSPKTTATEKVLHTMARWLTWLVTLQLCVLAWAASTLPMAFAYAAAAWTVNFWSSYADMWFKAKLLNRDISWVTSGEYTWIGKFDLIKSLKTAFKIASLGLVMQQAAAGAFTATLSLNLLPQLPLIQWGAATFFAGVAWLGATSLLDNMTFGSIFGFSDNTLKAEDFKDLIRAKKLANANMNRHPETGERALPEPLTPTPAPVTHQANRDRDDAAGLRQRASATNTSAADNPWDGIEHSGVSASLN